MGLQNVGDAVYPTELCIRILPLKLMEHAFEVHVP